MSQFLNLELKLETTRMHQKFRCKDNYKASIPITNSHEENRTYWHCRERY